MTAPQPDLLDLSRDPIVSLTAAPPGTAGRVDNYHAALEWLIARNTPFVLITSASDSDAETKDERKARAEWFKTNLAALAGVCKGFVYIEKNTIKRLMWEARARVMAAAFPVPMRIVSDKEEALDVSQAMIETHAS